MLSSLVPSNFLISPTIPQHSHPHPYLTKHVNHILLFLSYCISYKAISLPLVATVASAAAVTAAEVGGGGGGGDCGGGGGSGAMT